MDAFAFEVAARAGEVLDEVAVHSPALADAVVEPPRRPVPGARSFELPKGIFIAMALAYVVFLSTMTAAFGSGEGLPLLLAICIVYLLMYLGTPALFAAVDTGVRVPLLDWAKLKRRGLDTAYGPMSAGAVVGQVLIVPACVAFFGLAVLVIVKTL